MNRFSGLCVLAAVASLAVAGCGSVSGATTAVRTGRPASTATATATAAGLCPAVSEVNSLTVRRGGGAGLAGHFRFPRQITVTRPQQAQAVARAVCGLPRMPRGAIACPADFGISYRLEFTAAGRRLAVVTADPGGCELVAGAGPARWAVKSGGFWKVVYRAGVVPGAGLGGCGGVGRLMCAQGAP